MGGSQGPLGHPTASLSHLEEMRIDWKLVPSEKVCQQPELVRVVKDASDVWSREEVVHDDLLFQEVRQTLWRDRMRSQMPAGSDCSPEEQEERTIKGWIGKDNGGEETWWEPTVGNYEEAGNVGPEV